MAEINAKASKSVSNYTMSIVFLAVVVIGTIALYAYNSVLSGEIEEIKGKISSFEQNIKSIQKQKDVQVYSLLQSNKEAISQFKNINRITEFINHMNVIKGKHNLEMEGFNLSNGEIETIIKSTSDKEGIAYEKVKDFIKKYRNDELAKFDLLFVNSFEGMDDMTFKVKFKIK